MANLLIQCKKYQKLSDIVTCSLKTQASNPPGITDGPGSPPKKRAESPRPLDCIQRGSLPEPVSSSGLPMLRCLTVDKRIQPLTPVPVNAQSIAQAIEAVSDITHHLHAVALFWHIPHSDSVFLLLKVLRR